METADAAEEPSQELFLFKNFGLIKKVACEKSKLMCDSKKESHIMEVHDNSVANGDCIRHSDKHLPEQNPVGFTKRVRKTRFKNTKNVKKNKTRKLGKVKKPELSVPVVDAPECKKIEIVEEKIAEFKVDGLKIIGDVNNLREESGKKFKICLYRNIADGKLQCHLSTESIIESFDSLNGPVASSEQHRASRPLLKCKDCPFSSKNKLSFRRHELAMHVSEKPFKCQTCNYETTSNAGLKRHCKRHIKIKNSLKD